MTTNEQAPLYHFLTDSKFSIWKHMLLILSLTIISSNQVFMVYQDCINTLGNNIYWLCLLMLAAYLSLAYLNIYILAPQLLLKKKYTSYIALFSLLVILLPITLLFVQEYFVRTALNISYRLESYTDPLIIVSNLSVFMIMMICFTGSLITVLLRHWIIDLERINLLKKEHIQSEVDQLKDQITPDFLSNILNRTSVLTKTEPEKAADMLMRLGQLLRYQLYDCNRDKVFLNSEIRFLTNYLDLEQLYSGKFKYEIITDGDTSSLLVSPLLFMPFVQYVVNKINNQNQQVSIQLYFNNNKKHILFRCEINDEKITLENEFTAIKQRIELLYNHDYFLSVTKYRIKLRLNLLNT